MADGTICRNCGGLMIRTGSCHTCAQCGDTTGCGRVALPVDGRWHYVVVARDRAYVDGLLVTG